ncbi:MAG: GlcG/HbpS family heme-binding protein [Ktedonobacterales bacterium]
MIIRPGMPVLPLATARAVAAAAEQRALERGAQAAIVLLDAEGELVYFQRMDRVPPSRSDVALAKAQCVLTLQQRSTHLPTGLQMPSTLAVVGIPGLLPLAGGLVLQVEHQVIGAIGVSGVLAEFDGEIATAGAAVCAHLPGSG